ncbi:MAG: hypothetical protein R3Y40_03550 [Eubacteriales bacterium]
MIQKKEYAELYRELEVFEDHGIHIILQGVQASAFQVVQAHMIREVGSYMRDYVLDSQGHLKEVTFDDIR